MVVREALWLAHSGTAAGIGPEETVLTGRSQRPLRRAGAGFFHKLPDAGCKGLSEGLKVVFVRTGTAVVVRDAVVRLQRCFCRLLSMVFKVGVRPSASQTPVGTVDVRHMFG